MNMALDAATERLKAFADPSRVRLLALLSEEELTVAELTAITELPQPRVSTHLGRLKEAGLVLDRRDRGSSYYRLEGWDHGTKALWDAVRTDAEDPLLVRDRARLGEVLGERGAWADTVAGAMERHYSPGRTWESLTRGMVGLLRLGDVLDVASGDGAVAEILAPRSRTIACIDNSAAIVEKARRRLEGFANVTVNEGDMHDLPAPDASFDTVLLLASLSFTERPEAALDEAARVLRGDGSLVVTTLARHEHVEIARRYGHRNDGFEPRALHRLATRAGLVVEHCGVTSIERRAPHFEIVTLFAHR
jgi:DNA-binding transcriptional ArsR family regulator/protein-L-isoaspartate O-methyltransferase